MGRRPHGGRRDSDEDSGERVLHGQASMLVSRSSEAPPGTAGARPFLYQCRKGCGVTPAVRPRAAHSRLLVIRIHQLKARPALELAGGGLAGGRINIALARLAQEVGFHKKVALGRVLLAALLDEHAAANRGLSRRGWKINAGPAFGIVAVDDGEAQHVGHAPLHDRPARIADHAYPPQHAVLIKQHREDHRMTGDARADAALGVQRIINGAADIFLLVVEADVDLVKSARLGTAFVKVAPLVDCLPWRPSVAAAGEIAEGVGRHLASLQAELEAMNLAGIAAELSMRRCRHE